MPSKTEPQARLFAGIAHGWHPSHMKHPPSQAVAKEFNQADKGSALLSAAMKHQHAAGGTISPLASLVGNPMQTPRASTPRLGMPGGTARMRMPRVPIADTMRNIDQSMHGARVKLPKLKAAMGGKTKQCFPEGGPVVAQLSARAVNAVKDALSHLANKDASSAAATLRANPEAMNHPVVQQASQSLRSSSGIAPATRSLTSLVNQDTDRQMSFMAR